MENTVFVIQISMFKIKSLFTLFTIILFHYNLVHRPRSVKLSDFPTYVEGLEKDSRILYSEAYRVNKQSC